MDTPLPAIIDPGKFTCLRIWIPDDPGYRRAVMGAVSYLQNWFAWERDPNHLAREAAAVFRQAYTLTLNDIVNGLTCDCEEDQQPETPPQDMTECPTCGGIIVIEDDMGQVVTDVKIENGVLKVFFGPCCIFEYPITSDIINQPPPGEDPPPADDETWTPALRACAVATALADTWSGIARRCADAVYNTTPWNYVNYVKQAYPNLILDANMIYKAAEIAFAGDVLNYISGDFLELAELTDDDISIVRCKFYNILLESVDDVWFDAGMTKALRTIVKARTDDPLGKELGLAAWDAFASNDSNLLMIASHTTSMDPADLDCDCPVEEPSGETDPDILGWYWGAPISGFSLANGTDTTNGMTVCITPQHDVYGAQWKLYFTNTTKNLLYKANYEDDCSEATQSWGNGGLDHLELNGNGRLYAAGLQTLLDSLLGANNYLWKHWDFTETDVVASPTWMGGDDAAMVWGQENTPPAQSSIAVEIRLLHNINSPSHSA